MDLISSLTYIWEKVARFMAMPGCDRGWDQFLLLKRQRNVAVAFWINWTILEQLRGRRVTRLEV